MVLSIQRRLLMRSSCCLGGGVLVGIRPQFAFFMNDAGILGYVCVVSGVKWWCA
jgi:hypothetical protein